MNDDQAQYEAEQEAQAEHDAEMEAQQSEGEAEQAKINAEVEEEREEKAREKLRAELNNGYWNGIIPQAQKDFLEEFIIFVENKDLGVSVNKLNENTKYASIRYLMEKFLLKPKP
jgi:hypothetical protein